MSPNAPPDPPPAAARTELILVVRESPGRGHLYRFADDRITFGADPDCDLHLEAPGIAPLHLTFERGDDGYTARGVAGTAISGVPLEPDEIRAVGTADAVELGDCLIELAVDRAASPTTDRREGGRLQRSLEAERQIRAAGGPSLWVMAGRAAGAAVAVPYDGLSCGSGAEDALSLPDAGVAAGHFTVRRTGEGDVWLTAREPVRVRGIAVHEARLEPGDLVFVGEAICEVRLLEMEDAQARAADAPPPRRWPAAVLGGLAVACMLAAWWLEMG